MTSGGCDFEGSAQFEFQVVGRILRVRRSFLDSTEHIPTRLSTDGGSTSASAIVRQIVSSDPADTWRPFHVECEINDKDFFPTAKSSKKVGSPLHPLAGLLGLAGQLPDKMPEAEKPFPVDPRVSLTDDLDLEWGSGTGHNDGDGRTPLRQRSGASIPSTPITSTAI